MSSEFNAYSSWLGIPEDEQPPHYYRLLGLEPFENDTDAIRQAGKRVLNLVKSKERGPNSSDARRLRAEITYAASCLLDPRKKAQYDQELDAWFNEYSDYEGVEDEYQLEEPDLPMAKIVPSGSSGKIATKSKKGSSKSKSGVKAKSGSGKGKAGSSKGKAKKTKGSAVPAGIMANPKILAVVVVMVVGVLGLGSALAYVFLKSDTPVAKVDEEDKTGAAPELDEEADEAATEKNLTEEEMEELAAAEAAAEEEEKQAEPDAGEAEKTEEGEDKTAAETADTEKNEDPAAETAAGADPMTTAATETKTEPADPKKAEPKKEDPKVAAKEEPKKEEPPKEPEKDPFEFLDQNDSLDLPVFVDAQTSTTPVVLAKVYPKEGDRVNVLLSGGDAVLGDQGSFSLSGGLLTDPEPKWTVNYTDPTGAVTPVAKMAYKDTEISFAWTGEGEANINNLLRNCMLKITAGYGNRNRALRKPVVIEPLAVVMDQKGTVLDLPVVGMPEDEEAVTLKITHLLGGFPADPTYDPAAGEIKPGEHVDIMFSKVDLAFRATFIHERDGTVKLDFKPMIRGERRGNGPRPLKPYVLKKSFEDGLAELNNILVIGTNKYDMFKQQNKNNKELLAQADLKFQEDTRVLNEQIKALTALKQNVDDLSAKGKVQFRIYTRIGEEAAADSYELDLLKTKDYSTPPEAEKKPAAKPAGKKK